jgi:hypothetical protein
VRLGPNDGPAVRIPMWMVPRKWGGGANGETSPPSPASSRAMGQLFTCDQPSDLGSIRNGCGLDLDADSRGGISTDMATARSKI